MKREKFILTCMIFGLGCVIIPRTQAVAQVQYDYNKSNEARKLFLEANIALSEKRFTDAHTIAKRLIQDYAGDYQIGLYLRLYTNTFYFLDEDFQKGVLRPTPPGIQARIEAMKAKSDKTVIDLVKLAMLADGLGGSVSVEYLEEILQKFADSIWRDWAEWMLIQEREYRPREKYQDKSPEERSKLLMRDLYNAGKKFMDDHPNSYMLPKLLKATADWGHWGDALLDAAAKQEAVGMCYRVLRNYPTAEYDCAEARRTLRELLGNNYKEIPGCSEEGDRIITQFYCISPEPAKQKKYTALYVKMIEKEEAETKPGLPVLSYVLITSVVGIVIAGLALTLLLKKKASSRGKSRAT